MCVCLSTYKRRRHTKGCIACMYSRDNRQYFLFLSYLTNILTVVWGSVGGVQRKGYRVLYTVVVRFIARSRFVRSFVYCICVYNIYIVLTRRRPGRFVCSTPLFFTRFPLTSLNHPGIRYPVCSRARRG